MKFTFSSEYFCDSLQQLISWFHKMTNDSSLSIDSDSTKCNYLYNDEFWAKQHFTDVMPRNLIAVASINSIVVLPTIFLNALVIYAVAIRPRLRSNTNVLLACMAATDFLCGTILQPLFVAKELKYIFGVGPSCILEKVYNIALAGVGFASIDHHVLISIERYVAIKNPLRYREIVTKQWLKTGVLLAWALAVFVTMLEIVMAAVDSTTKFYSAYVQVMILIYTALGLVYMAIISYTNVYIFFQTRRHKKRIQNEQVTHEEAKRMKKDHRAANTLAIILGVLVLTNLPALLVMSTYISNGNSETTLRRILRKWALAFASLRPVLNPIIYCWRVKKLRQTFLEILHLNRQQPQIIATGPQPIQPDETKIKVSTSEAFSMPVWADRQEPVLASFRHLEAEEIVRFEETAN